MRRNYIEEMLGIISSDLTEEEIKFKLLQYHESDIADLLESIEQEQRERVYAILGDETIADILSYVENVEDLVEELSPDRAADIIEKMDVDDAIDVLEELEVEYRTEIVSLIDEEAREDIKAISKYEDNQIGSSMTNNYITILKSDTIKSAMKKVISEARENDNIANIFVLNEDDTFYGIVELRDLIIARENDELEKIIKKNHPTFLATDEIDDCIVRFKEYAMDSYPILDENQLLLGVITSEDVIEVVDDEMGDDYAKLAGLTEEENIDDSVFASVKKRLPWLIILLVLGLFQSFAMTGFERLVAALPVIVFFQTLILSMAGNSGTQSLAVTIRSLSDEIDGKRKILKMALKELRTGFLNAITLALISFIIVYLFMFITKQSVVTDTYHAKDALKASSIVAVSLMISMTFSTCIGALIPIMFLKLKVDPAVASGPFITTVSDIAALLIYYGLANLLFLVL